MHLRKGVCFFIVPLALAQTALQPNKPLARISHKQSGHQDWAEFWTRMASFWKER
jgi:hypothetical protein